MRRLWLNLTLALFAAALLCAQPAIEFTCPMDRDVRSKTPGKCPRCGMTLVAGIPEPVEYPVALQVEPPAIPSGRNITLEFRVSDPGTGAPVKQFEIVHEKLIHLFIVSQDLQYFAHLHPQLGGDAVFRLETSLPKPGTYRLLADFYPIGGTPQMAPKLRVFIDFLVETFGKREPDLVRMSRELRSTASLVADDVEISF